MRVPAICGSGWAGSRCQALLHAFATLVPAETTSGAPGTPVCGARSGPMNFQAFPGTTLDAATGLP